MGKMQTAAEDAYRHRHQYDVVVWAVTESDVTLISSYVDAARLMGLARSHCGEASGIAEAVKRWFENNRWQF
jgi:hypothetical protein